MKTKRDLSTMKEAGGEGGRKGAERDVGGK